MSSMSMQGGGGGGSVRVQHEITGQIRVPQFVYMQLWQVVSVPSIMNGHALQLRDGHGHHSRHMPSYMAGKGPKMKDPFTRKLLHSVTLHCSHIH